MECRLQIPNNLDREVMAAALTWAIAVSRWLRDGTRQRSTPNFGRTLVEFLLLVSKLDLLRKRTLVIERKRTLVIHLSHCSTAVERHHVQVNSYKRTWSTGRENWAYHGILKSVSPPTVTYFPHYPQTVISDDWAFKCMSLWGLFSYKQPHYIWRKHTSISRKQFIHSLYYYRMLPSHAVYLLK